jgi:hypothetical protein
MRNKNKAFLSCAMVAALALLASPAAMATGSSSCSSFTPTITILAGPCPVDSATPVACATSGRYTGIKYKITGNPDHVATVVTSNNTVLLPTGFQSYAACTGDPVTELGKGSCHEKAVKVNPNSAAAGQFWLVVDKTKTSTLQSMVAKKGSCSKAFAVAGLGLDVNPFQAAQKVETVNFKGCAVKFQFDVSTGAVVSAALDPDDSTKPVCPTGVNDGSCCAFNGGEDVGHLELSLNGQPLGAGVFGEGYVSSGTNSCTTRVIGGRVYSWGSPCPE